MLLNSCFIFFKKCAKIGEKPIADKAWGILEFSPFCGQNIGMRCIKSPLFFILFLLILSLYSKAQNSRAANIDSSVTDVFIRNLLQQYPQFFDSVLANRTVNNVQIIYTKIDRGANGIAALKHYYFNVNEGYFYPASAIKLPVAMLALQRMNEWKDKGIDRNTTMLTGKAYSGQTAVYNDPTTPSGKPTVANYIRKMMMVSDNDAYNRLYELLGQQYINEHLHQKSYPNARVVHRLEAGLTDDEQQHTNPITFVGPGNRVLFSQDAQYNGNGWPKKNEALGKAYYDKNELVDSPMNFSNRNKMSLQDLHQILISLVFPNKVTATQRFNLTDDDRKFILKYMSQLPTESLSPPYSDDSAYYPALNKFLLYGAERKPLPSAIRIFNKVGFAYGQLTDVAYIADFDKKVEFFLSATIYCNSDGVLNDDKYDYNSVGLPFMKQLGEVIYDYELKRERKIAPDLTDVILTYDGR